MGEITIPTLCTQTEVDLILEDIVCVCVGVVSEPDPRKIEKEGRSGTSIFRGSGSETSVGVAVGNYEYCGVT